MKTSKSVENTEITPSQKKLKQARLPFKILSDVSPTPVIPSSRKRKLSASDTESEIKVAKVSKQNDLVEDLVVISDEDSKDASTTAKTEKSINPYVNLVDMARMKRLQKTSGKKKKVKKSKKCSRVLEHETDSANDTGDDCEVVGVNESQDEQNNTLISDKLNTAVTLNEMEVALENTTASDLKKDDSHDIIEILDHSNNSSDVNAKTNKGDSYEKRDFHSIKNECMSNKQKLSNQSKKEMLDSVKEAKINLNEADDVSANEQKSNLTNRIKDEDLTENNSSDISDSIEKEASITESPKTPMRCLRNRSKIDFNDIDVTPKSSKLNKSSNSNPTTPNNNSVLAANSLDETTNSTQGKNLTPKQVAKKIESAKKREERENERLERERKRLQEKEERAKQKQEKEEQKKKEKEEKEEQKRKEKEERKKQKELEKKLREEKEEQKKKEKEEKEEQKRREKEEKEEQRRKEKEAREEERRKKQEALETEKQEQELKKKKAAEAFANFFVPKQKFEKDQATIGMVNNDMLSNFTLKVDMRLAPTVRRKLEEEDIDHFDLVTKKQDLHESELYVNSLKCGKIKPLHSGKTWPLTDKDDDDDIMIIEDELPPTDCVGEILTCEPTNREKLRPKLLSFSENRRPAYWGTWRKKSTFVKPRKPFGQDQSQMDYEVDSDEEWEEEEGENIDVASAAGSDDEPDTDKYEIDNKVFVPHGYLSDEEATMDDDNVLSLSPETQKAKLKHLEDEFESEIKKPTEKLKPRLYGLIWETKDGKPETCGDPLWRYFEKLSMIMDDSVPMLQPSNEPEQTEKKKAKKKKVVNESEQKSPKVDKKKIKRDEKESRKVKLQPKKIESKAKKTQPGINMFLSKNKPT